MGLLKSLGLVTRGPKLVTKCAFSHAVSKMKDECEVVFWSLVSELEKWFPKHEMMTALGIV